MIRKLNKNEYRQAVHLSLDVFTKEGKDDFNEEGLNTFRSFIFSEELMNELSIYGAFENEILIGIIGTKRGGTHISLFFIRSGYRGKGIGRMLFEFATKDIPVKEMTVNSSSYAVEIYRSLGFREISRQQETNGLKYTPMKRYENLYDKERIRELILSLGADVCGFSTIERFEKAPEGYRPTDIYSKCKTVVVFGAALTKGLMQISPRLVYGHFNNDIIHRVDAIALEAAKKIEENGQYTAVPIPSDSPYEYWDEENREGRGLLSMKHAAVNAGLGSIGKNSLFLNRKYGNRLCIGAILLDIELPSDALSEEICLPRCHKCIDHCPVKAIQNGCVVQKLCRNHTYGKTKRGFDTVDCNTCRTVCPVKFGS